MESSELLMRVYEEIKLIKEELDEIKKALIPEDTPSAEEIEEIELGMKEMERGERRPWKDIKKIVKIFREKNVRIIEAKGALFS